MASKSKKWYSSYEEARSIQQSMPSQGKHTIIEVNPDNPTQFGITVPTIHEAKREPTYDEMVSMLRDQGKDVVDKDQMAILVQDIVKQQIHQEKLKQQELEFKNHRDTTIEVGNQNSLDTWKKMHAPPKVHVSIPIKRNSKGQYMGATRILQQDGKFMLNTGNQIVQEMIWKGSIDGYPIEIPLGADLGDTYNNNVIVEVPLVIGMHIAHCCMTTFKLPDGRTYIPPSIRMRQKAAQNQQRLQQIAGSQQGYGGGEMSGIAESLSQSFGMKFSPAPQAA